MTAHATVPRESADKAAVVNRRAQTDYARSPFAGLRLFSARWRYAILLSIAVCALLVEVHRASRDTLLAQLPGHLRSNAMLLSVASIGVCLVLLAAVIALQALEQRASLARLAVELERQDAEGIQAVLPDTASGAVARLMRAINRIDHRHAERLAELLDVQAAFLHDLRTPLARLGIRCESLYDAAAREAINQDLRAMNELVAAGLACTRMQYSAAEQLRCVDADGLLGQLLSDYRDSGRYVALDGHIGQPVVSCPHALRRVLANLIDNALHHGSDVRLSLKAEARHAMFAVSYSGRRIDASEMEAGLAPWYRAPKAAERVPGSGLALAIARRLTTAMRGELQLKNRRTGGLEVRITLPLVVA